MSDALPLEEAPGPAEEQREIRCGMLESGGEICGSAPGKRAPKLGQIGRSKRVVIEDDQIDEVLNGPTEKLPAGE